MRFCSNCGAQNDDDARFCGSCGAQLEEIAPAPQPEQPFAGAAAPQPEQQMYAQPEQPPYAQQAQPPYAQPAQPYNTDYVPYQESQPISAKCRTFGIIGFILGIISTAFSWICFLSVPGLIIGVIFLACGIVGLVFCNISIRNGQFTLARVGKVFSIIGIVLCSIMWVIALIIIITTLSAVATVPFYY